MDRRRYVALAAVLVAILTGKIFGQRERRTTARPPLDECALYKADDAATLQSGQSTYIELGEIDVANSFSLSMDVFPSTLNHNGILFSLGTRPNFEYYEWKTAAVNTQFIVIEFIFSALALTVKSLGTQHLHQIEIYKTYPTPYAIDDAQWHTVKATMEHHLSDSDIEIFITTITNPAAATTPVSINSLSQRPSISAFSKFPSVLTFSRVSRNLTDWMIKIDGLEKKEPVTNRTDVQLYAKPAFIGGRPNYTDHQFQGAIRKLRVNGRPMPLGGRRHVGNVEVWHCREEEVSKFLTFLKQQKKFIRH